MMVRMGWTSPEGYELFNLVVRHQADERRKQRERLSEAHPFMRWARGQLTPGTEATDRPGRLLPCFGFPAPEAWIPVLRFFTHPI